LVPIVAVLRSWAVVIPFFRWALSTRIFGFVPRPFFSDFNGGHSPSGPDSAAKLSSVCAFSASEMASIMGLGSAILRLIRFRASLTPLSVTSMVIIACPYLLTA
jgi:hypothetical protein